MPPSEVPLAIETSSKVAFNPLFRPTQVLTQRGIDIGPKGTHTVFRLQVSLQEFLEFTFYPISGMRKALVLLIKLTR